MEVTIVLQLFPNKNYGQRAMVFREKKVGKIPQARGNNCSTLRQKMAKGEKESGEGSQAKRSVTK
jgi:hypothetical protein